MEMFMMKLLSIVLAIVGCHGRESEIVEKLMKGNPTNDVYKGLAGMYKSLYAVCHLLSSFDQDDFELSTNVSYKNALVQMGQHFASPINQLTSFASPVAKTTKSIRETVIIKYVNGTFNHHFDYRNQIQVFPPLISQASIDFSDRLDHIQNMSQTANDMLSTALTTFIDTMAENKKFALNCVSSVLDEKDFVENLNRQFELCTNRKLEHFDWDNQNQSFACCSGSQCKNYVSDTKQQLNDAHNRIYNHKLQIEKLHSWNLVLNSAVNWLTATDWIGTGKLLWGLRESGYNFYYTTQIWMIQPFSINANKRDESADMLAFCNYFEAVANAATSAYKSHFSRLLNYLKDLSSGDVQKAKAVRKVLNSESNRNNLDEILTSTEVAFGSAQANYFSEQLQLPVMPKSTAGQR